MLRIADPLFTLATGVLAFRLYFDSREMKPHYMAAALAVALIPFAAFPLHKLNQSQPPR